MADRIFKGKIRTIVSTAFRESAMDFNLPHHMGKGLVPYEMLKEVLQGEHKVVCDIKPGGGDIWISNDDVWIRIETDGTIEIGASGA